MTDKLSQDELRSGVNVDSLSKPATPRERCVFAFLGILIFDSNHIKGDWLSFIFSSGVKYLLGQIVWFYPKSLVFRRASR